MAAVRSNAEQYALSPSINKKCFGFTWAEVCFGQSDGRNYGAHGRVPCSTSSVSVGTGQEMALGSSWDSNEAAPVGSWPAAPQPAFLVAMWQT